MDRRRIVVKGRPEQFIITPGGRIGDDSPRDLSPKKNWVDQVGGLPRYIRIVRNALLRHGHSMETATAIAVATMKRWAAGLGNVRPQVRAAAAAALAEWEAKRAKARADNILPPGH